MVSPTVPRRLSTHKFSASLASYHVGMDARISLQLRLRRLLDRLGSDLVERRDQVRLLLLAALAGEHCLLIGPPGTAKSELARRLHRAFGEARYFERLLTRFSVPEELFGPLSIRALEEDRYERHIEGFLPQASIAFIDEVFKANSAILNALLTLLNEREFDNGTGRVRCPLISVVGASNEVPEDEVAAAFFDRFLLRIPVTAVSEDGFRELLSLPQPDNAHDVFAEALDADDRRVLADIANRVALPGQVAALMAALREHLHGEGMPASDRRWVKIAGLLRVAAASEGRDAVSRWDLALLPCCLGPDDESQQQIREWLAGRLGLASVASPPRLTRVVEAFEGQLVAEQNADDLDYDESGRLRMSADKLAGEVGDAKGGGQALRMTYTRKRRFGETHVRSRVSQIDALLLRIEGYDEELAATRADFEHYLSTAIWLEHGFAARARTQFAEYADALSSLRLRAECARAGFEALPRLDPDPAITPEPVAHEALD